MLHRFNLFSIKSPKTFYKYIFFIYIYLNTHLIPPYYLHIQDALKRENCIYFLIIKKKHNKSIFKKFELVKALLRFYCISLILVHLFFCSVFYRTSSVSIEHHVNNLFSDSKRERKSTSVFFQAYKN